MNYNILPKILDELVHIFNNTLSHKKKYFKKILQSEDEFLFNILKMESITYYIKNREEN